LHHLLGVTRYLDVQARLPGHFNQLLCLIEEFLKTQEPPEGGS
jgi:hypothetical protein